MYLCTFVLYCVLYCTYVLYYVLMDFFMYYDRITGIHNKYITMAPEMK